MLNAKDSIQHTHKIKQYQAIIGNYTDSNFTEFGNFTPNDTASVYADLARYTKTATAANLKIQEVDLDTAKKDFLEIHKDYSKLAKDEVYQQLSDSLTFGYTLPKELTTELVLHKVSEKLEQLSTEFLSVTTDLVKINKTHDDIQDSPKNKESFAETLKEKAEQKKKEKEAQGKVFNIRNFYLNSYFGHVARMMGQAAEVKILKTLEKGVLKKLDLLVAAKGKIAKPRIVGDKTRTIGDNIYTSKGDISFTLKTGENTQAVFGSVKFRRSESTQAFTAVKGTSLKAIPASENFKTDFLNLFLSTTKNNNIDNYFLTSLIVDFALVGVFNRPMYFLEVSPTTTYLSFFYEMYESYATSPKGGLPYIKMDRAFYTYSRGKSPYKKADSAGGTAIEQGRYFYKNVRYKTICIYYENLF